MNKTIRKAAAAAIATTMTGNFAVTAFAEGEVETPVTPETQPAEQAADLSTKDSAAQAVEDAKAGEKEYQDAVANANQAKADLDKAETDVKNATADASASNTAADNAFSSAIDDASKKNNEEQ